MAFTVEDGTGVTGANAYLSVAAFDAYAADENQDVTSYTTAQKEGAIVVASRKYVDTYFSFGGEKLSETQGLALPTKQVALVDDVKYAVYMAALLHLQERLFVPATVLSQKIVESESKSLGKLSKSTTYAGGAQYTTKYPTTTIDRLLTRYASTGGAGYLLRG